MDLFSYTINLAYFDKNGNRKLVLGEVGKNGIKSNTYYATNSKGKIIEIKKD